ncbi:MAG TPA: helix-turn-helix transcriptional regulator [Nitrospiria bacterium]
MKRHRQYVREQINKDPRFARDLEKSRVEIRLAVMITLLREKRGWSQRDLARRTGILQPQIARIEKGERLPSLKTLWRLADALNAKLVIGPHKKIEIKAA